MNEPEEITEEDIYNFLKLLYNQEAIEKPRLIIKAINVNNWSLSKGLKIFAICKERGYIDYEKLK